MERKMAKAINDALYSSLTHFPSVNVSMSKLNYGLIFLQDVKKIIVSH